MISQERIAELRAMAEAATKRPWHADVEAIRPGEKPEHDCDKEPCLGDLFSEDDAAYIAAACNALPELLDALEAAQADSVRLDALGRYEIGSWRNFGGDGRESGICAYAVHRITVVAQVTGTDHRDLADAIIAAEVKS